MIKLDKLFGDKKNSAIIYLLLAMGIMLMLFGNSGKTQPATQGTALPDSRSREAELILSEIKGAGQVRVMISDEEKSGSVISDEAGKKSSVLIVADGGNDSFVREKIIRAASAALGVDSHKIQVFERKD